MPQRVLNSWKEIAHYVGRGVRTVQRWERDLGFPVRRPRSHQRSAVIAFPDEIDAWLKRTHLREPRNGGGSSSAFQLLRKNAEVFATAAEALNAQRKLLQQCMSNTLELSRKLRARNGVESQVPGKKSAAG